MFLHIVNNLAHPITQQKVVSARVDEAGIRAGAGSQDSRVSDSNTSWISANHVLLTSVPRQLLRDKVAQRIAATRKECAVTARAEAVEKE
jgi:hypothetical protein